MRRIALGLTLVGVVMALSGCGGNPPDVEVEFRIPVEVEQVITDNVERIITATGTLRPQSLATLNNEVPGHLYVSRNAGGDRLVEGELVTPGQTIAEITGEDARLHAGIESKRLSLENVKSELDRRRNLFEQGLIAETEMRSQEVQHETALLEYERSKLNASKSKLTTPIAGAILELARNNDKLPIADGQLVAPGFKVAEIAPLDNLIADVDLVGPELAQVAVGMPVRVRHFAFEQPNEGSVLRVAPKLDPQTHTFRIEVAVDNANGNFRPGMFVEVNIIAAQRADVPVVPRFAVTRRGDSNVVFLVNGQRVNRRDVRTGLSDEDKYEIIDGVKAGDRVVTRGLETLTDGTRIRIIGS
ncbi:MAG: efflux RND transporter periplasmic adaptor subunit [Gammaproteobacteria bacterium]|nr:efflux RND transporter periplasmic adaptor subunit [Gammaproteobacteria bacterium]